MKVQILIILAVATFLNEVSGHGFLWDPVNRASRWRIDGSEPKNYNDNELFCGGANYQHNQQGGRCGLCGDPYGNPTPRAHEFGGLHGNSIVKTYQSGSIIPMTARLTANHRGGFVFQICNLDNEPESEACFNRWRVHTPEGRDWYELPTYDSGDINFSMRLPAGLSCNHCVLQWTYTAANNWGTCPDGSQGAGCGPQETFRTCSDIRIH